MEEVAVKKECFSVVLCPTEAQFFGEGFSTGGYLANGGLTIREFPVKVSKLLE